MPTSELQGRVAIVTGASAGIGEAIARDLASRGASVVLNARRADRSSVIADEIRRAGGNATTVAGDAADGNVIDAMFSAATEEFGADADIVVANAGRGLAGSVVTSDDAQWEEMVRTNLLACARLIKAAAPRLVEGAPADKPLARPRDLIVIGSNVGKNISPYSSMYGSTKFAAGALAEGARRELAPKGVRVSLISPGFVRSEFQGVAGYDPDWFEQTMERVGPPLAPQDVARVVSFIVSQPPGVHVNDVVIRPTRQDYP